MGLCWVGSQEDIRPPLGRHINQNAYVVLSVGEAWESSAILYGPAVCGAGAVKPLSPAVIHFVFIVLVHMQEEEVSVRVIVPPLGKYT